MFHKPQMFSPPRPPTEREKTIIHEKMLEEIGKMQHILQNWKIDAEYVRESDRRYCTQLATRFTSSIFMKYDRKLNFRGAFRQDPFKTNPGMYLPRTKWEDATTMEKHKAIQDKQRAESSLNETFEIFDPEKVRKAKLRTGERDEEVEVADEDDEDVDDDDDDDDIFYIIMVIIWHFFPIVCIPKPVIPGGCQSKPRGIALRSLSMKNPFPSEEDEGIVVIGWSPPRPADDEIQQMINKFKIKAENKMNKVFSKFKAESYQTQVVAGVNYSVKIKTDVGFLWMMLYKPPNGEASFFGVFNHDPTK